MGTQLRIHELIGEIEKEGYILPEVQRCYVWNPELVKEYLPAFIVATRLAPSSSGARLTHV